MPRPTDWIDTIIAFSALAGGSEGSQSLMTGVAPVNMRGMTLIRTILRLGLFSTTVAGAWGVQGMHMAIGVASQEAFAAGILPDPDVATDKPPRGWVWRSSVVVTQSGATGPITQTIEADIRGARKIENGELYIIARNADLGGTTFTVLVSGIVRTLYKL